MHFYSIWQNNTEGKKLNKIKNSTFFTISAFSAALVCQTATTYASDIEIYKAPTTGGSTLTLILDISSSMHQGKLTSSSTDQTPVNKDFFGGISCTVFTRSTGDTSSFEIFTTLNGVTKSFQGRYCFIEDKQKYKANGTVISGTREGVYKDITSTKDRNAISNGCISRGFTEVISGSTDIKKGTRYYCPDRLTTLKKSLFELIAGNSKIIVPVGDPVLTTVGALPDTTTLGITTFNASITDRGFFSLSTDRVALLEVIKDLSAGSGTAISNAMASGARQLSNYIDTVQQACAGYGLYFLTDGEPYNDNRQTAKATFASIVKNKSAQDTVPSITSRCSNGTTMDNSDDRLRSWECTTEMASILNQGYTLKGVQVKTAVVGFGNEFRFADSAGDRIVYLTTNPNNPEDRGHPGTYYTDTILAGLFNGTNNRVLQAVKASVRGGGGWYSPDNAQEITDSVQEFVRLIKVSIPAITTGTATIPQDSLNAVAIQPFAYFPQFQPKPSEDYQLWGGNLKKYKVLNAVLKDKDDANAFGTASGTLNTAAKDLWVKGLATDSELNNIGGILGKLNLKATSAVFNRKVLTNAGATLSTVDETYIKGDLASRKYLLGLLGYDLTEAQLNALTATSNLTSLSPDKTLRNMGAVMHSTPVLLTQAGKVEYIDETANGITTSKISTATRDDYLLFGTTQGVLHVVKVGAESDTTANYTGGHEVFAFVPQEILANQPRAFLNETESGSNGMNQLYYGVDGQWVAHTEYVYNSTSDKFLVKDGAKLGKQWVYGGMRMGGRSYYALDLTDMSSPAIKFRIDPATSKVYSPAVTAGEYSYSHLSKMGESWSKPVIANVQWQGKRRLVMFVGGGYDRTGGTDGKGYETFNYVQTNGLGAGVFMFDAHTGEPLWSTYEAIDSSKPSTSPYKGDGNEIKYSIVSQIKAIDREGDGDVDHLYFGDLGGQVFRIDLNSAHSPLTISSTATETQKNAAINSSKASFAKNIVRLLEIKQANGLSPRFYEAPGFSIYLGTNGNFAVVSIGSGNRSNPLLGKQDNSAYIVPGETAATNSAMINDAVYNLFDVDVVKKDPMTFTLRDANLSNLAVVTDENRELGVTPAATAAEPNPLPARKLDFTGKKGWYYAFTSSTGRKAVEKAQGDVIVIDHDLYVSTFDAEAVGSTEACGAGIYGASKAHRFCMPYGQCPHGDTAANNKLTLGNGLLGITLGGGTDGNPNSRSIVAPLSNRTTSANNKILGAMYRSSLKLTPLSWYEKN